LGEPGGAAVAVRRDRAYVRARDGDANTKLITKMPENASIPDAIKIRGGAVVLSVGGLGLVLAATVALWAHYGTAVFFEMIRAGLVACFG
jgi:hypothetical protein